MDKTSIDMYEEKAREAIEHLNELEQGTEEYEKQMKQVNNMIDRLNENKKIDSEYYNVHDKIEAEKKTAENEVAVKEKEVKANKWRTISDFGKGLLTLGCFAAFEFWAHSRDMNDAMATDPTHVSKNPMKLKFW